MSAVKPRITIEGEPSYVSSPGAGGVQFLTATRVMKNGALEIIRVLITSDGTIGDVARGETSRSKLRDEFATLFRETRVRVGPAPTAYVVSRIRAAMATHRAAGKTFSANETGWLEKLAEPGEVAHPTVAWSPVDERERRIAAGIDLHGEMELRSVVPSPEAVNFIAQYVDEHGAKSAEEGGADEKTRGAFLAGIDAFYSAEERKKLGLALRDTALVFLVTQRADRALDAVASAEAIEDASGLAPHEVPFVMSLFYKFMLVRREMQRQG